jgi:hypothetical protein
MRTMEPKLAVKKHFLVLFRGRNLNNEQEVARQKLIGGEVGVRLGWTVRIIQLQSQKGQVPRHSRTSI